MGKLRSAGDGPDYWLGQVLSAKEMRHVKPKNFKNGTLNVYVDSSGWLYYLSLHKKKILSQLGAKCDKIKNIRFFLGETR